METLTIDTLIEQLQAARAKYGNLNIEVPDVEGTVSYANTAAVSFPRKWNAFLGQWDVVGPAQCVRISNEY